MCAYAEKKFLILDIEFICLFFELKAKIVNVYLSELRNCLFYECWHNHFDSLKWNFIFWLKSVTLNVLSGKTKIAVRSQKQKAILWYYVISVINLYNNQTTYKIKNIVTKLSYCLRSYLSQIFIKACLLFKVRFVYHFTYLFLTTILL